MAGELMPGVPRANEFAVALHGYVSQFPRIHKPLLGRALRGLSLRPRRPVRKHSQSCSIVDPSPRTAN
jgi:hypothetical protein